MKSHEQLTIAEAYNPGDSIEIKGRFTNELLDSEGNPIKDITDEDREFEINIPGISIIKNEINHNPCDLSSFEEFFVRQKIKSKGETKKQLAKLPKKSNALQFLSDFIPGYLEWDTNMRNKKWNKNNKNKEPREISELKGLDEQNIRGDLAFVLSKMKKEGVYQGEVVKNLKLLLEAPFEILLRAIEYLKIKDKNGNLLWTQFFRPGVNYHTKFLPFTADNVQKGKPGVYFYTINDGSPVYVGKSGDNFNSDYGGYKSGNPFYHLKNGPSTRARINSRIADAVSDAKGVSVKWYNIPLKSSFDIDEFTTSLSYLENKKGVDVGKSFPSTTKDPKKKPYLDFLETAIMSRIKGEKWNTQTGGFDPYLEITK